MDVTPQELRSSEIKDSWRGYDRDEVDDLLERAAVTIESLTQKMQDTANRPVPAASAAAPARGDVPLPSSRDDADMLQRTLLLAQRAADDAVNDAQARARQLLEESEAKAQSLVSDAEATARRIAEGERRRLEAEILELSTRRERLRSDADALEAYATGYRERIRAVLEADIENLGTDGVEPPSSRPELHDVDLPPEREPGPFGAGTAPEPVIDVAAEEAAHEMRSDPPVWEPRPASRAVGSVDVPSGASAAVGSGSPFGAEASSTSRVAAPPRPMAAPAPAEWPPPAPAPEASAAGSPQAESSWLSSEDEWAPPAEVWDAPAPWERETAQHEPFAQDVPMEATAVDADSLDDDAFFASLREAVHDDAPLGPRDEDQATFFDAEAEQERRRFRRRR